jgi:hypothetical protein
MPTYVYLAAWIAVVVVMLCLVRAGAVAELRKARASRVKEWAAKDAQEDDR